MAECAITGQTVVSQHYCVFVPRAGERRFYALASPPANEWRGTAQTLGATAAQVAADIAAIGQPGALKWNPKVIPTNGSYLRPLRVIAIEIADVSSPEAVLRQIAAGASTPVATQVPVGDQVLDVTMTLDIWPPFRDLDAQRHPAGQPR